MCFSLVRYISNGVRSRYENLFKYRKSAFTQLKHQVSISEIVVLLAILIGGIFLAIIIFFIEFIISPPKSKVKKTEFRT